MKKSAQSNKKIEMLEGWEWETLVGAWRYYEYRSTIVSASFPHVIVQRYWGGGNNYSDKVRIQIARQFAEIDHGARGERDWTEAYSLHKCDICPWTVFYAFCKAYLKGFNVLTLQNSEDDKSSKLECFFTESDKQWRCKDVYIARGEDMYVNKDCILDYGGWGGM